MKSFVQTLIYFTLHNLYNKRQCPRQQNNQQQKLFLGRKFFRDKFLNGIFLVKSYLPKSSLAGQCQGQEQVRLRLGLGFGLWLGQVRVRVRVGIGVGVRVRVRVRIELGQLRVIFLNTKNPMQRWVQQLVLYDLLLLQIDKGI